MGVYYYLEYNIGAMYQGDVSTILSGKKKKEKKEEKKKPVFLSSYKKVVLITSLKCRISPFLVNFCSIEKELSLKKIIRSIFPNKSL